MTATKLSPPYITSHLTNVFAVYLFTPEPSVHLIVLKKLWIYRTKYLDRPTTKCKENTRKLETERTFFSNDRNPKWV